jgi:hypothetical protein
VGRAFSGDPKGTADMIAEAIKTPGFSFIEILSPCVTFRPEQREWRKSVRPAPVTTTDDPARAARLIMSDDGFNIGILYRGDHQAVSAADGQWRQGAGRSRERIRDMKAKKSVASVTTPRARPRKSTAAVGAKSRPATGIASIDEMMAYAYALELEASERYAEFADAMDVHNNREVAGLFRKLSASNTACRAVLEDMGWLSPPPVSHGGFKWRASRHRDRGCCGAALPDGLTMRCRLHCTTRSARMPSSAAWSSGPETPK